MRRQHFLGRGLAFPIRPTAGRIGYLEGDDKIEQSIWLILATAPGERVMRPDFGCGIHDLVFEPNTASLRAHVQVQVEEALVRWEPRIDVQNTNVSSPAEQRNQLDISIEYQVRNNNAFHNLVYPFFLNESVA